MTTVRCQLSPSTVCAEKQTWVTMLARQAALLPEPFCWPEPLSHCFTSLITVKENSTLHSSFSRRREKTLVYVSCYVQETTVCSFTS